MIDSGPISGDEAVEVNKNNEQYFENNNQIELNYGTSTFKAQGNNLNRQWRSPSFEEKASFER